MDGFKISNIIEIIERSVFLRLLEACVESGYTPDIQDSVLFPNDASGQIAYKNALRAIVAEKGFAIEIYNHGGITDKGDKEVPRIVIISENFEKGNIGYGFSITKKFDEVTQKFVPNKIPTLTSDFYYRVVLVGNKITHYRTMSSLVALALPNMGYIPPSQPLSTPHPRQTEDINLFNRRVQQFELDDVRTGTFERSYRYCISDVFEVDPDDAVGTVPINSILVHFLRGNNPINDLQIDYTTKLLASETNVLASSDDLLSDV